MFLPVTIIAGGFTFAYFYCQQADSLKKSVQDLLQAKRSLAPIEMLHFTEMATKEGIQAQLDKTVLIISDLINHNLEMRNCIGQSNNLQTSVLHSTTELRLAMAGIQEAYFNAGGMDFAIANAKQVGVLQSDFLMELTNQMLTCEKVALGVK